MSALSKSIPLSLLALSAALLTSGLFAKESYVTPAHNLTGQQIYQQIKTNFEANLYTLPPRVQGHYAIRQYRMTGDTKYANGSLIDLLTIAEAQAYFACNLDKPNFIKLESALAGDQLGNKSRGMARKAAIVPYPKFMLFTDLLRFSSRIDEFGFTGPCHNLLLDTLKAHDFAPAFTDKKMIESWAAQLINYVFWAKQVGVGDYYQAYKTAFINTYPDSKDASLSKAQYKNKIYGMTHFIFAASGYYQNQVDPKEFKWILDYFEKNLDKIIADTTEDIITEVGISFLITGHKNHPVTQKVKQYIIAAYNPETQMIPSPSGVSDLSSGEHRNVLAMMLLDWPETLHPGPYLGNIANTKKNLPRLVKIKPAKIN
ncbi:DUF3541 domain-containing protein [Shewanella sp. OMA3-2]|uniref:DUF3541 domain-containing protein n=1 Tax=Shewanella sp. OMA3-2 TaxID=2908650 RepID=UPI001F1C5E5A|nr:DUF3541 domain-containing protein [Shewanella sp. OMA3-2]UJF20766.1 DUF3541 domain-containing protein [Shewanella sp. OMA3-2]